MRNRLTQRVAADATADKGTGIMNDPYQVNNPEHEKNDPAIGAYAKGDPSAWGEDVNRDGVGAEKDKRDPATHIPEITAKMAAEAIQAGRKLEERAVKCIVASQRILPGADDSVIEAQAADLMQLPDPMIDSLLGRQEDLASTIAKAAAETSEKVKKDDEEGDDEVEAAAACKKENDEDDETEASAKQTPEQIEAEKAEKSLLEKKAALEAELAQLNTKIAGIPEGLKKYQEEQKAKKEGKKPEENAEVEAGEIPEGLKKFQEEQKAKKEEDSEEVEAGKKSDKPKADAKEDLGITFGEDNAKDASEDLLDDIFSGVIASDTKKGAKSLSGLVKKEASEGSDPLKGIWDAPPDVSAHFQ